MFGDEVENRNVYICNCNNNENNNVRPYSMDNMNSCNECENFRNTREEMLKEIKSLQFAIIELGLYLDTHPDDSKALCLHKKYARELKELKDKYQKVYGPLTINFPCNKWRWLEEPWASFILEEKIFLNVLINGSVEIKILFIKNKKIL